MVCYKKLEKLVNMIKKSKLIIILFLLIPIKSHAFSEQNEQQMYIGCYKNSKQYLGADKAKNYCLCTIQKLSEKFSDKELDGIFKQNQKTLLKLLNLPLNFVKKKSRIKSYTISQRFNQNILSD
jgi:hypothetical protein